MENIPTPFEELSSMLVDGLNSNYKQALEKSMVYFENRRQNGFNQFTKHLLNGTATKEKLEYERMFKITEDQYYALINASIEDENKEKSYIYANLYRNILHEKISKEKYSIFIRIAKILPYSAIELLPKIYIYKNNHTKHKNLDNYINELKTNNIYELKILEQNGFFTAGTSFDSIVYDLEEKFFEETIPLFFNDDDLIPLKHDIDLWKEKKALIIMSDKLIEKNNIIKIQNILDELSIFNEIQESISTIKNDFYYCILITDYLVNIDKLLDNIKTLERNCKIINVSFNSGDIVNKKNDIALYEKNGIEEFKKQFSD